MFVKTFKIPFDCFVALASLKTYIFPYSHADTASGFIRHTFTRSVCSQPGFSLHSIKSSFFI